MVIALDSGSSSLGLSGGQCLCVVLLGKTLITLTVPLSTQEYKWMPANIVRAT